MLALIQLQYLRMFRVLLSVGVADAISPWLEANGIPRSNVFLLPCVVNRQLPHLIKQADVAVFASRCEGGTNLMAMETLACGVPTLISANTGHLDLLAMGFGHALPMGQDGSGQVDPRVSIVPMAVIRWVLG